MVQAHLTQTLYRLRVPDDRGVSVSARVKGSTPQG